MEPRGGSRKIFERWGGRRGGGGGVDLIILNYLVYAFPQTGLSKQCKPRSDAEEQAFTGSKLDLLKGIIKESVLNLISFFSKIYYKNIFFAKRGVGVD